MPHFPLEVITRGERTNTPVALVDEPPERLLSFNAVSKARGLHVGMTLNAAYAVVPTLRVLKRDARTEDVALKALAGWANQFTSFVSLSSSQSMLLEVGGSARLFGGLQRLVCRIREETVKLGYFVQLAVAPTPLGASLLAHAGLQQTVDRLQELPKSLASIPLECMHVSDKVLQTLREMGLRTFGDCYRLPREGLARRLGPGLLGFMDRALGKCPDPRPVYKIPSTFTRHQALVGETCEAEALLFGINRLLVELCGYLIAKSAGVQQIKIRLMHRVSKPTCISLRLVKPSHDVKHLNTLVRERLKTIQLGAGVEEIELRTPRVTSLSPQNHSLFYGQEQSERDWTHLLERLEAQLGVEAIRGLTVVAEHRPERSWITTQINSKNENDTCLRFAGRPLWLLDSPRSLRSTRGKPHLRGELYLSKGPERIESGWWDGSDITRDYYVATNPVGERFWVFCESHNLQKWYLHGVFA
jgi:protein ImuB